MAGRQGYSIITQRFRLRCRHPEWLKQTQAFYNQIEKFYYDLFLSREELWEKNSQEVLHFLEILSLPGKEKRTPEIPLPWDNIPPYFRRAAANAGIAAARSFLVRADSHDQAAELNSAVVFYSRMYRDFSSEKITLKVWDGNSWHWMGCRLNGKKFPEDAVLLSPSVVFGERYIMLHVPVKGSVQNISSVKTRLEHRGNICGLQFTNGDAFAVASVRGGNGEEKAVRFFGGGLEYAHHCRKVLKRIESSEAALGLAGKNREEAEMDFETDGSRTQINRKYWMHLKHLSDHYAHQVSRDIIRFCEENQVSVIVLPKYKEEYTRKVMKGSGNWGPLHLSSRIRSYLRYKAWNAGMIVVETYARGTSTVCAKCGQPVVGEDEKTKEYLCRMGHRGNWYLNTARNLAGKCRRQFEKQELEWNASTLIYRKSES